VLADLQRQREALRRAGGALDGASGDLRAGETALARMARMARSWW